MSAVWIIAWFFIKHFVKGFFIGVALRLLIALIFKGDATWGGTARLGIVMGVIYLLLTCHVAGLF